MLKTLMMASLLGGAIATDSNPHPVALVGDYDGAQMEIAAGLRLKADGRFDYAVSYGALDEESAGNWEADDRSVVLTSDPVTAPSFSLMGQKPGAPDTLRITLDVPDGNDRQFFDAHIILADGCPIDRQLGADDTTIRFKRGNPPVSISLSLDIFDVRSDPVAIDPAKGYDMAFRFEPGDVGKVRDGPLRLTRADGALLLERFGRTIRFERVKP